VKECDLEASTNAPPQAAVNVDHVENDRRKRVHLLPESKQIVYNVYEGVLARGCSNPIKDTSELTRVPYIIYEFYKNNVVPKTKNLMGKLEEKGFEEFTVKTHLDYI
jgi:hypothetical protein